jgi:hypothetical protein
MRLNIETMRDVIVNKHPEFQFTSSRDASNYIEAIGLGNPLERQRNRKSLLDQITAEDLAGDAFDPSSVVSVVTDDRQAELAAKIAAKMREEHKADKCDEVLRAQRGLESEAEKEERRACELERMKDELGEMKGEPDAF